MMGGEEGLVGKREDPRFAKDWVEIKCEARRIARGRRNFGVDVT